MRVKQVLKKLETEHPEGLSQVEMFLASDDLLPVGEEMKTWDHWNFVGRLADRRSGNLHMQVAFWIADSFNLNTFGEPFVAGKG